MKQCLVTCVQVGFFFFIVFCEKTKNIIIQKRNDQKSFSISYMFYISVVYTMHNLVDNLVYQLIHVTHPLVSSIDPV